MTQSPILFVRLLAIAWCVAYPLATAGCARHKTDAALAAPAPAPEPRLPVALRVTNSNWSDVRIYVVRGAMWLRLGTVTTNSTVYFTIPLDYLTGPALPACPGAPRAASGQRRLPAPRPPCPPLPPFPPAPPGPPVPPGPPGLRPATMPARNGLSSGTITVTRPPCPPDPPGPPLPPLPPGAPGCAGQPAAPEEPSVPLLPVTPVPPRPPRDSITSQSAGGTAVASCST